MTNPKTEAVDVEIEQVRVDVEEEHPAVEEEVEVPQEEVAEVQEVAVAWVVEDKVNAIVVKYARRLIKDVYIYMYICCVL